MQDERADILIYSRTRSPRLRYAMDLVIHRLLGLNYELSTSAEEWHRHDGPKMSYGLRALDFEQPHFHAHNLLFETTVERQLVPVTLFNSEPVFYQVGAGGCLPFDPFACAFFMASRYEEYTDFEPDVHNRFPPEQSMASRFHFMKKPVVHIWTRMVKDSLLKYYPHLPIREPQYTFRPTYDVDIAWAYKNKGLIRNLGGYIKDLFTGHLDKVNLRAAVLNNKKPDPFFTFNYLQALHEEFGLDPIWFFIVGDRAKYDKNPSYRNKAFAALVKDIADSNAIGLHPSYLSNTESRRVKMEKERLEKMAGRRVNKSRQHYLMIRFPQTYRQLLSLGITDDYTLGYTSAIGFRTGLAVDYPWYDLMEEQTTALRIHPFAIMDATMQYYQDLPPEEVITEVAPVINAVKEVGGTLITLFHNNTFSEMDEWVGWRNVYRAILEKAS